jgi:hypothetical protein
MNGDVEREIYEAMIRIGQMLAMIIDPDLSAMISLEYILQP